jgi:hypothetical protein
MSAGCGPIALECHRAGKLVGAALCACLPDLADFVFEAAEIGFDLHAILALERIPLDGGAGVGVRHDAPDAAAGKVCDEGSQLWPDHIGITDVFAHTNAGVF